MASDLEACSLTVAPDGAVWSVGAGLATEWVALQMARQVPLPHAMGGLRVGHGRLLFYSDRRVWLLAEDGRVCRERQLSDSIQDAELHGPEHFDLYAMELGGPPYDRTGHRLRFTAEGPERGESIACAWGCTPPRGALGVQTPVAVPDLELLAEGPGGRLHYSRPKNDLRWSAAGGETVALELDPWARRGAVVCEARLIIRTEEGLLGYAPGSRTPDARWTAPVADGAPHLFPLKAVGPLVWVGGGFGLRVLRG